MRMWMIAGSGVVLAVAVAAVPLLSVLAKGAPVSLPPPPVPSTASADQRVAPGCEGITPAWWKGVSLFGNQYRQNGPDRLRPVAAEFTFWKADDVDARKTVEFEMDVASFLPTVANYGFDGDTVTIDADLPNYHGEPIQWRLQAQECAAGKVSKASVTTTSWTTWRTAPDAPLVGEQAGSSLIRTTEICPPNVDRCVMTPGDS